MFGTEYEKNNQKSNEAESSIVKEYFRFRLDEREELLKIISAILQKNSDLSKNIKDLETSIEKYYKYEEINKDYEHRNSNAPKF